MIVLESFLLPQCGQTDVATILSIIIGSVIANVGIYIEQEKLVNSQPLVNIIRKFVGQNTLNTPLLAQASTRDSPSIVISTDEGSKNRE